MSIQSNINQMLSVASVALQMNPTLKAKAKERETMKDLSRKEKAAAKASELVPESDVDLASSVAAEQADLAERRFKLKPTEKNYKAASQKRSVAQERLDAARKAAQERLEAEQNERRQNRAITSAGMSLDEFPEHVQAIIKKQLGGETK